MSDRVAFILKGYPRLSETFIAQEILGLEQRGLAISIYSLRPPRDEERHPIHDAIKAPVHYLPERPGSSVLRLIRTVAAQWRAPGFRKALRFWISDLRHDPSLDRFRRFGQALLLAHDLDPGIVRLHAHFLHTPGSVARYASALTGLPWSCSAHARDIWTISDAEKRAKLAHLDWLVTCTQAGYAHLAGLAGAPEKVGLVYHGLDLQRFPTPSRKPAAQDGVRPEAPVRLLSVGRAVEKKGFDVLLKALAGIDGALHWHWTHIGNGADLPQLQTLANDLGLAERVDWRGALTQPDVIAAYRGSDLFVLPSRVAGDGDRDGLPNVLMEAMSQGLACLSTTVSGIPELIENGKSGVLVQPDNVTELRKALRTLITSPGLRDRLGHSGAQRVAREFSHEDGLDRLARRFGLASSTRSSRPAA